MSNLLNNYFSTQRINVLKKLRLAVPASKSILKKNTHKKKYIQKKMYINKKYIKKYIYTNKKKVKFFSKFNTIKFIKLKLKNLLKKRAINLKKKAIKSYIFLFKPLIRKLKKKYRKYRKVGYKKKKKRYLFGNSKLYIYGQAKDRYKYAIRKIWPKVSLNRRFNFYKLPRLFFFWFIILYNDLYVYLSKIVWNNWFKFLYSSFIFTNQTKLFYSVFSLYNIHYIKNIFSIDNNFYDNLNYNFFDIFNKKLNFVLGGFNYFFFNGIFLYDLKYISLSFPRHVNLFIKKTYLSKKNIKLKRFFTYKF